MLLLVAESTTRNCIASVEQLKNDVMTFIMNTAEEIFAVATPLEHAVTKVGELK